MFLLRVLGMEIAAAWWLIYYLVTHDRGPKEPVKIIVLAGGLGAIAAVVSLILEVILVPQSIVDIQGKVTASLPILLSGFLGIGIIEELTKAGPLALFIYKKGYFNEFTDGIIYFATAGMLFGLLENISYTLSYGAGVGLLRLLTGPFMHAGFSALIGWGIIRRKLLHTSLLGVFGSFTLAIVAHGLYDAGLASHSAYSAIGSLLLAVAINASIFILYKKGQKLDEARGLSTRANNNFCLACGKANPQHFLFCTYCGHKT